MTFDDGPHPSNTPRLLDILKQLNVKATIYVVGTNARRYPAIMRRMIAEGHEIGNHTESHAYLTKISEATIRKELATAHQTIVSATGVAPRTMRPPYGAITSAQKSWKCLRPGSTVTNHRSKKCSATVKILNNC